MHEANTEQLREIEREIASAIIFSSDDKMLMGRKDPRKGGVFPDAWHIPGGGAEPGEELPDAVVREVGQEVVGLDLRNHSVTQLPHTGNGASAKVLESGERVWCKMHFNYFEVHLDQTAEELAGKLRPGDDLAELRWFSRDELAKAEMVPGGAEFFVEMGYMDPVNQ